MSPLLIAMTLWATRYEGQGAPRGNISLRHDDGTVFGPWEVITSAGSFVVLQPAVRRPRDDHRQRTKAIDARLAR